MATFRSETSSSTFWHVRISAHIRIRPHEVGMRYCRHEVGNRNHNWKSNLQSRLWHPVVQRRLLQPNERKKFKPSDLNWQFGYLWMPVPERWTHFGNFGGIRTDKKITHSHAYIIYIEIDRYMDQVGEHEILCVLIEAVFTFLQENLASTGSQLSLQLSYIHFSSINVVKNIYIYQSNQLKQVNFPLPSYQIYHLVRCGINPPMDY